jgi:hypothetical protein
MIGAPDVAPLTEDDKLYGAAFKVVYERLNPDACGPSEWPKLCATAEVMRTWAREQEPAVRRAYERAIDGEDPRYPGMMQRAAARVENVRRGVIMTDAYNSIAKPPV